MRAERPESSWILPIVIWESMRRLSKNRSVHCSPFLLQLTIDCQIKKNVFGWRRPSNLFCDEHLYIAINMPDPVDSVDRKHLPSQQHPPYGPHWIYWWPTDSFSRWLWYRSRGNGSVYCWKPILKILIRYHKVAKKIGKLSSPGLSPGPNRPPSQIKVPQKEEKRRIWTLGWH